MNHESQLGQPPRRRIGVSQDPRQAGEPGGSGDLGGAAGAWWRRAIAALAKLPHAGGRAPRRQTALSPPPLPFAPGVPRRPTADEICQAAKEPADRLYRAPEG